MSRKSASIADEEIARFSGHAADWWNPEGPFRPLHRLNPVRLGYVRDQILAHQKITLETGKKPLSGLTLLDIGCGGGLMTEPLARLGASVTGIDASDTTIDIARQKIPALEPPGRQASPRDILGIIAQPLFNLGDG